jgi:hypothetical protein
MRSNLVIYGAIAALVLGIAAGAIWQKMLGIPVMVSVTMPDEMAEVSIVSIPDNEVRGITDSAGMASFEIRQGQGEPVMLRFTKADYEPVDRQFVVVKGISTKVFDDIRLRPKAITMNLRVVAKDDKTGQPVVGKNVIANGIAIGRTGQDGTWTGSVKGFRFTDEITVVLEGTANSERLQVTQKDTVSFSVKSGVSTVITVFNKLKDVQIYAGGQLLGTTDAEGRATVGVPVLVNDVVVSFRLTGAKIRNWTIPASTLQAADHLEHEIQAFPEKPIRLTLTTYLKDYPERVATGYEVKINGQKSGVTRSDGGFNSSLKDVRIGDALNVEVMSGNQGYGSQDFTILPTESMYSLKIPIVIPKIVQLVVKDARGRAVPGVSISRNGKKIGSTNSKGVLNARINKLNVEYQFTFNKTGYSYSRGQLAVRPTDVKTFREIVLEPLQFIASFLDERKRSPVFGIEVWYKKKLLLTTAGAPEAINIPKLGKHKFELKSSSQQYPKSQTVEINVKKSGEQVAIYVKPRNIEFRLEFVWDETNQPVRNRQVRIKGQGYIDQKHTDDKGKVVFSHKNIEAGTSYDVTLIVGQGTFDYKFEARNVVNTYKKKVKLCSNVSIEPTRREDGAVFELYRTRTDFAVGKKPLHKGTGRLDIPCLSYGEFFMVARGEDQNAKIEKTILINSPAFNEKVALDDPYAKCKELLDSGQRKSAMLSCEKVPPGHPRFADARKELVFFYLEQDKFSDAHKYCQGAINDATVNPYLFLGCAQASHQKIQFPECLAYADGARRYSSKFKPSDRLRNRTHSEYLKCLCQHDSYFTLAKNDESMSKQEKEQTLASLFSAWERFIDNNEGEGDIMDAEKRKGEVENEILAQ